MSPARPDTATSVVDVSKASAFGPQRRGEAFGASALRSAEVDAAPCGPGRAAHAEFGIDILVGMIGELCHRPCDDPERDRRLCRALGAPDAFTRLHTPVAALGAADFADWAEMQGDGRRRT